MHVYEFNFRKNTRPDWKRERQTNQETFGHSAVRSLTYRRVPRPQFSNGRPGPTHPQAQHYNGGGGKIGQPRFQPRHNNYTQNHRPANQ